MGTASVATQDAKKPLSSFRSDARGAGSTVGHSELTLSRAHTNAFNQHTYRVKPWARNLTGDQRVGRTQLSPP